MQLTIHDPIAVLEYMKTPPIILGDLAGILQLPKAPLCNPSNWTQEDSDILAHFIQVDAQVQRSRWHHSKVGFRIQAGTVLNSAFPKFEDFVFAAVYIRQFVAEKDSLLADAVSRYIRFVDCQFKPPWVQHELDSFNSILASNRPMLPGYTVRELFDAFIYGAGLMHKIPPEGNSKRKRFLDIYDNQPRHMVLYELNMSLHLLMNHVSGIAAVIYRDYSNWLDDYRLPRPDTRWHEKLFEI